MNRPESPGHRLPDPRMIPGLQQPERRSDLGLPRGQEAVPPGRRPPPPAGGDADDSGATDGPLVRPFLVTGGRTRPLRDGLRIETLVSAEPAALYAPLRFELSSIVRWCQVPLSVAEIASRLGAPIGVARVLIADLLTENLVVLRQPTQLPISVIERIRDRVRAL